MYDRVCKWRENVHNPFQELHDINRLLYFSVLVFGVRPYILASIKAITGGKILYLEPQVVALIFKKGPPRGVN